MQQIMLKSARQSGLEGTNTQIGGSNSSSSPLIPYFTNLPLKNQLGALQGGYKAVSSEFSQLANKVNDTKITIVEPTSVQKELENKLPLLSVKKEDDKTSTSTDIISDTNDTTKNVS